MHLSRLSGCKPVAVRDAASVNKQLRGGDCVPGSPQRAGIVRRQREQRIAARPT